MKFLSAETVISGDYPEFMKLEAHKELQDAEGRDSLDSRSAVWCPMHQCRIYGASPLRCWDCQSDDSAEAEAEYILSKISVLEIPEIPEILKQFIFSGWELGINPLPGIRKKMSAGDNRLPEGKNIICGYAVDVEKILAEKPVCASLIRGMMVAIV